MLQPKRVKYRRPHGLSYEGKSKGGTTVDFGEFGLQALEGDYITARQIEAARIVLSRYTNRQGQVWIKIFPHLSKTKKPAQAGRVMFEIGGVSEDIAREALRLAAYKLPIHTKIVKKGE